MLVLGRIGQVDKLLILAQSLLVLILLNDNQVAASLRVGILLEEIVRQTEGCHQVGLFKEQVQTIHVLTIEVVARRDKRHHSTVTHGIQALLHKIAVQGFGDGSFHHRLVIAVDGVKDLGLAKGYIGDSKVELSQLRRLDTLEAFHMDVHAFIRMEFGEQQTCQLVFLEGCYPGIGVDKSHGVDEHTHARRRFQYLLRPQVQFCHDGGNGIGNVLGCVEGCEDGLLHTGDIEFILVLATRILTNHVVEFGSQVVQRKVVLWPCYLVIHRTQHTFQPTEAAVTGDGFPLCLGGYTYFIAQGECRADSIDIGLQPCLPIERHTARCKVPRHLSTPCIAAHSPLTVQTQAVSGRMARIRA